MYDGQCEQISGTYSARVVEARLREVPSSCGPFQPTIPTTQSFADSPTPFRVATAYAQHCKTRAAQGIKCIADLPLTAPPSTYAPGSLSSISERGKHKAWVSPIRGLNQKITPSPSGDHAQPQTQSSLDFNQCPEGQRLTRVETLVSFPVLNQIKP